MRSSRAHHPEVDHYLCLADKLAFGDGLYPAGCTVIPADRIGIPDFPGLAFRYDIVEFNTAVKPYMILHLFSLGYDRVIYFDPDIKVYRPIASVFAALDAGASLVLTPHLTAPAEHDVPPDDITIMRSGTYNLGFAAFARGDATMAVLHWWARRLRYQCVNAQQDGIFVDQKFVDLVPGFLPDVAISRDTALNVAYWNLFQRRLEQVDDRWLVDGAPLIFYHFSGYDPRRSDQLSKYTPLFAHDNPPELIALIEDYRADLLANGLNDAPRGPYAYERFASGIPIAGAIRRYFRDRYLTWEGDPFETFERHLSLPAAGSAFARDGAVCTNLMAYLRDADPALRAACDIAEPIGVSRLVRWFLREGPDAGIDLRLAGPVVDRIADARRRRPRQAPASGGAGDPDVSVIGYLTADIGVGEAGRLTLRALAAAGRAVEGVDVGLNVLGSRNDRSCAALLSPSGRGRVQIFHINADQLPFVQDDLGDRLRGDAYRIAVPFWELADFPDEWLAAFDRIDEIWAPTRFIQTALITKLDKPVLHMPLALDFPPPADCTRSQFGLPEDRFLFFFAFDCLSFGARKNPAGVIEAFRTAFAGHERANGVTLVIKCMNIAHAPDVRADLGRALDGKLDIRFFDRELDRMQMLGLIGLADCVVSLHRSEGLGLLVAEAMALGIPVIATDYSATTELITPVTGYPVDYRLVPVRDGEYPFAGGRVWADPDPVHAAWQMRQVVDQAGGNGALLDAARRRIEEDFGLAAVGRRHAQRFAELGLS